MNPKYKGRVGIPAYGWVGNSWLQVLNKTLGGNEDNVDPGIAFLAAAGQEERGGDPREYRRGDEGVHPRGDRRDAVLERPHLRRCKSQGVPVDIEYVPGSMLVGNGFPILRGGKFIELTNRFVNITMDGQYQMRMTKRFFYPPSNRNAKLPPDLAKIRLPADKEKNVAPIDYEKMNAHKSEYLDRWNKEVLGA